MEDGAQVGLSDVDNSFRGYGRAIDDAAKTDKESNLRLGFEVSSAVADKHRVNQLMLEGVQENGFAVVVGQRVMVVETGVVAPESEENFVGKNLRVRNP